MTEVILNEYIVQLLTAHGFSVKEEDEFVYCDELSQAKFKARAIYSTVNDRVSSQLDVMVITEDGYKILESFGDFGTDKEDAFTRNFTNFTTSSFHLILAALGATDKNILQYLDTEIWEIEGKAWTAYIGGLVGKNNGVTATSINPTTEFFKSIEKGIKSQSLPNKMHWFRSFYFQYENEIKHTEFLMDNEPLPIAKELFAAVPILPDVDFCSYRNFILLKKIAE
nr:DUF6348 family protein [uncultured Mucilaginibacter sp.]